MRKKIRGAVFLVLLLVMIMPMGVLANDVNSVEAPSVSPRWSYTSSTSEILTISSDGTARMTSVVMGYSGTTTKIKAIIDLQKYSGGSWKRVKTYMDVEDTWYAAIEHTYSGLDKGYTYRMKCTYTVYSGSNYDKFTLYSKQVTY